MRSLQIVSGEFDGGEGKAILASQLYEFLELNNSNYSKWFKKRIENNEFLIKGEDYLDVPKYEGTKKDCILIISVAKKLAMSSNSKKGEEVRDYFIKVEKEFKKQNKALSAREMLLESAKFHVETEKRLQEQEKRLAIIEAKQHQNSGNTEFFTIMAYARLSGLKLTLKEAVSKGRQCSSLSKEYGVKIGEVSDERFGKVNSYYVDVLDEVFNNHKN